MKKATGALVLLGFLGGMINIIWWFTSSNLFKQGGLDYGIGEILGYTAMLLALSTVFFGVKRHRDLVLGGKISFKSALTKGLIIVAVAATTYVVGWEVYYPYFAVDFGQEYSEYMLENLRHQNLSESDLAKEAEKISIWVERYNNPLYRIPITLTEILPLGLIVALASALILRKE